LDITHFQSLTDEEVQRIQKQANRIVQKCRQITKGFMPKDEAEKKYGFHLYQGGVVPGNELRVVDIAGTDTEACCGTHADNTAEVGTIKILKTNRISDGIVRLYFVAGERALDCIANETDILNNLCKEWGVNQPEIAATAERFFDGYKRLSTKSSRQEVKILDLTMKVHLLSPEPKLLLVRSDQANPTLYISNMPQYAEQLKATGKGVVFVGKTFLYGLVGDAKLFDAKAGPLQQELSKMSEAAEQKEKARAESEAKTEKKATKAPKLVVKDTVTIKGDKKLKTKAQKIAGVQDFTCFGVPDDGSAQVGGPLVDFFLQTGFVEN